MKELKRFTRIILRYLGIIAFMHLTKQELGLSNEVYFILLVILAIINQTVEE